MTFASLLSVLVTMTGANLLHAQEKDGFTLVKREGVVSIYEKWVNYPGANPPVKSREMKAEFYYHNSIYAGLDLLRNEGMITKWQSHVSEYKIYTQRDTATWHEYSYHDVPWPVSDQDHFMEYKIATNRPGMMVISFRSKVSNTLAPLRKGASRMILNGTWTLEEAGPGKVKATYKVLSKPADIPRIFTDPVVRNNIVTTMQQFISILEKKA
jgi:hypothetical protein